MGNEWATKAIEREQLMEAALHQGTTGAMLPPETQPGRADLAAPHAEAEPALVAAAGVDAAAAG